MIRIIADSTCDFTREEADRLGIGLVPLTIHFKDGDYLDGVDLSHGEFFTKLAGSETLPTTSQANPAQFEEAFRPWLERGQEILVVTISSRLSATMQSAVMAAQRTQAGRIHLVDSGSASIGAQLLLREAVRLRDEGNLDAAAIAARLRELAPRLQIVAVVDTLKYLKMGGRLSGGAALIGGLLGIRPVIEVRDGKVEPVGKVRGEQNAIRALTDRFDADRPDVGYGVFFGNTAAPERMERAIAAFGDRLRDAAVHRSGLGSVIGTHTGPGVVGLAYLRMGQEG